MVRSAKIGQPPLTPDDFFTIEFYITYINQTNPISVNSVNPLNGFYDGPPLDPATIDQSIQSQVEILGIFTIVLITILTLIRIGLAVFVRKIKWGWDDTVYMMAFVIGQVCNISCLLETYVGGMGLHMQNTTYYQFSGLARWSALAQYFYYIALALIKISLTLFVIRAIGHSSHRWRVFLYSFLGICIAYTIACFLIQPLALRPWAVYFNVAEAGRTGRVIHFQKFATTILAANIGNAILDIVLVCIPIVLFFKMRVPLKKKIRLMLMFAVGLGTILTLIARAKASLAVQASPDLTWYSAKLTLWGFAEYILSFLVANSATFNAIYVLTTDRWRETHSNSEKSLQSGSDHTWVSAVSGQRIPAPRQKASIATQGSMAPLVQAHSKTSSSPYDDLPDLYYARDSSRGSEGSPKIPDSLFSGKSVKKEVSNETV